MYKVKKAFSIVLLACICACHTDKPSSKPTTTADQNPAAMSLVGKPLYSSPPSEALLEKFGLHEKNYADDPSPDNLIWVGRFTAYQGKYKDAINIYSQGIKEYPKDARFYRHRGHRYITTRQFDKAIADFLEAVELIRDKPNEIEPDGMPNARNIPVSTLHGNIWYHLGLAYYLNHEYQKAHHAYLKCRDTASSADNLVSSTHWLYMIARRLQEEDLAQEYTSQIHDEMDVIENFAYHKLCLFYQDKISEDELLGNTSSDAPASDAILYGLANWHYCNRDKARSKEIIQQILAGPSWGSFGYLAAESDLVKYY